MTGKYGKMALPKWTVVPLPRGSVLELGAEVHNQLAVVASVLDTVMSGWRLDVRVSKEL